MHALIYPLPSVKACPLGSWAGECAIILHGIRQNDFPVEFEGLETFLRDEPVVSAIVSSGELVHLFLSLLDVSEDQGRGGSDEKQVRSVKPDVRTGML